MHTRTQNDHSMPFGILVCNVVGFLFIQFWMFHDVSHTSFLAQSELSKAKHILSEMCLLVGGSPQILYGLSLSLFIYIYTVPYIYNTIRVPFVSLTILKISYSD